MAKKSLETGPAQTARGHKIKSASYLGAGVLQSCMDHHANRDEPVAKGEGPWQQHKHGRGC